MTQAVLFEKKGAVGEIILNRPEDMNAMNIDLIEGLMAAIEKCRDPQVRVVVLKGNGKCFCAGGDIKFFKHMIDNNALDSGFVPERLHEMMESLRGLEKPVLASVHGPAAGAGAPLALACDLVMASDDSVFNFAYARIGLTPDGGSTFFLPRHVGMKKAAEIFMLGTTLKANEAKDLGLINWVVPAGELKTRTDEMALKLALGPTKAMGRLKKLLDATHSHGLHQHLDMETIMVSASARDEDFKEGVGSFLEKRSPKFSGK